MYSYKASQHKTNGLQLIRITPHTKFLQRRDACQCKQTPVLLSTIQAHDAITSYDIYATSGICGDSLSLKYSTLVKSQTAFVNFFTSFYDIFNSFIANNKPFFIPLH